MCAHRLDLITLMRVTYRARRHSARLRIFRYARSEISQISGKTFRARKQRRAFARSHLYAILNCFLSLFYADKLFPSQTQRERKRELNIAS